MGKQKKSGAGSFLSGARAVLGATLALAVVNVSATVLTFEGTAFGDFSSRPIPSEVSVLCVVVTPPKTCWGG